MLLCAVLLCNNLVGQISIDSSLIDDLYISSEQNPDKAIAKIDSIISNQSLTKKELTHLYFVKSDAYYYLEDIRKSDQSILQALEIMPDDFPKNIKTELYNAHGQNLDILGKPLQAITQYQIALAIAKETKDSINISNLYYNISLCYKELTQYFESLNYLDSTNQIVLNRKDSFSLSHNLRAIGSMKELYFDYESARSEYKTALKYVTKKDPAQECVLYVSLSNSYLDEGFIDSSYFYIQKAKKCYDQTEDRNTIQYLFHLQSEYFIAIKDTVKAINYLKKCIDTSDKTGDYLQGFVAKIDLLNFDYKNQNKITFEKYIQDTKDHGNKILLANVLSGYAAFLNKNGDYKNAYKIKSEYIKIKDDIIQLNNQKIIQSQAARFEIMEKESDLKLAEEKLKIRKVEYINKALFGIFFFITTIASIFLYSKNKEFKLKQSQLQKENTLLEQLKEIEGQAFRAQMNPHFIFNALNSVKGLIVNNQNKKAAIYISKFSKLVRNILDNSRMNYISVAKEIETLEIYIKLEQLRFRDSFVYNIDLPSNLSLENIILPPTLLQPFIENSIWHGFKNNPRANKLNISIATDKEFIYFDIEDNGIGFEESSKNNLNKSNKSHGIEITQLRIDNFTKLKSGDCISYKGLKNDLGQSIGTVVTIKLPLRYEY